LTRITEDSTRDNEPLVSILIPTYNSAKTIKECLDSTKTQTYINLETIVIDNHSSDETRLIAEKYCSQIFVAGSERSAQMNYGVSHSHGKYILRVDSDMILDKTLVKDCLDLCQEGVQAVVIPVLPHPNGPKNFWVSCRMLEQRMIMDDLVNVAPRFIDRTVFLSVGGYDEKIVAFEDYDLHNRLLKSSCSVVCLQKSALWHLGEPSSLSDIVIRMMKYGKTGSLGQFTKKHGSSGLKQISIIRPSYFRHRHFFISDPLHFTGIFVMKLVQSCSLAIGALLSHLP
jgi:glycosyltransferase involved in cell wall biosynthesis